MHIHVVPNTDNPVACATAAMLATSLATEGHTVTMPAEDALAYGGMAAVGVASASDLVVSLGGDGTILRAAHLLAGADVPIFGINLGRLGFLCGADDGDALAAVHEVLAGRALEERRATLAAEVTIGGRGSGTHHALNEVFVGRSVGTRAVDVAVAVDDEPLARWVCDGVVIATPTGSSAYALSAGGPLVAPDLRASVVVPVSPHTLRARAVVLGEHARITVTLPDAARAEACVAVDGDPLPCRSALERVEIMMAPHDVRLLRIDERSFVRTVRDTFFGTR